MNILSISLVILLLLSVLFNILQRLELIKLVKTNKELKNSLDSAITYEITNKNYVFKQLEVSKAEILKYKRNFLYCLSLLNSIEKHWQSKLTFYNPKDTFPTIMMKFNKTFLTYEIFNIGGSSNKELLDIDSGFKIIGNKLSDIINTLRLEQFDKALIENGGIVPSLEDSVNSLNS